MAVISVPRPRLALAPRALRVASDERLVAQVRAGSQSAFEAIYDRHHAGLLSFCRHMLGTREEAEDAVQHTFVGAYQALLADDRDVLLKAWLYTIARNRCLSILRARREHVCLDDVPAPAGTAGLSAEVERRDDLRALLDDLAGLPDDQRAALVLAELGAHSHAEIALILGVPAGKVKALVFQAREALMNRRVARDADCTSIREQLAQRRGGARRRLLRLHLAQCDGCRAFEGEVRRQGAAMGVLLPVAPTLALKHGALAAAFAAGPAASGAVVVVGGASALGGASSLLGANAVGAKVLLTLALIGAGGGYVAAVESPSAPSRTPPAQVIPATKHAALAHAGQSSAAGTAVRGQDACAVGFPCAAPPASAANPVAAHQHPAGCDAGACAGETIGATPGDVGGAQPAHSPDATPASAADAADAGKAAKPATAAGSSAAPAPGGSNAQATKPAKPDKPVTPAKPSPADTATPAKAAKPDKPAKAATPAAPATPAASATPATPAKPATAAKPATPASPGGAGTPATPATPADPATPATPATPASPASGGGPPDGLPPQANGSPGGPKPKP
jgi:RNA polymerase sigma factor (sigma-70 family)